MHVGHDRDMSGDDRQRRDVLNLLDYVGFHFHAVCPGADVVQLVEIHDVLHRKIKDSKNRSRFVQMPSSEQCVSHWARPQPVYAPRLNPSGQTVDAATPPKVKGCVAAEAESSRMR